MWDTNLQTRCMVHKMRYESINCWCHFFWWFTKFRKVFFLRWRKEMKLSLFSDTFNSTNVVQTSSRTLQVTPCPFLAQLHVASVDSCPLKLKQPTNEILAPFQSSNRSSWKVLSLGKFTLWIWEWFKCSRQQRASEGLDSKLSNNFYPGGTVIQLK